MVFHHGNAILGKKTVTGIKAFRIVRFLWTINEADCTL